MWLPVIYYPGVLVGPCRGQGRTLFPVRVRTPDPAWLLRTGPAKGGLRTEREGLLLVILFCLTCWGSLGVSTIWYSFQHHAEYLVSPWSSSLPSPNLLCNIDKSLLDLHFPHHKKEWQIGFPVNSNPDDPQCCLEGCVKKGHGRNIGWGHEGL